MEKKTKEEIERERTEYLDLRKEKEDMERDPTKKPSQRVSGWNSKLRPAKEKIKRDRMGEKLTIARRKMP